MAKNDVRREELFFQEKEKPLSRSPQKKADLFQTYNGKVWDESERNFSFGRKKSPSRTLLKRKPIFLMRIKN